MKDDYLGSYFKKEEKKARKLHREVDPSSWPEYVTATQSRVRRVMAEERSNTAVHKVASSIENLYMDEVAQDVAHTQVSKSRRGKLPRKITVTQTLAWGGWGIAMITFASSLLFNVPFGAGSFVLKALPGEAREGEIVLTQSSSSALHPGDALHVEVHVATAGKKVSQATAQISYNPNELQLSDIDSTSSDFSKISDSRYDAGSGRVFLTVEGSKSSNASEKMATLNFIAKTFVGTTNVQVIPDTYVTFEGQKPTIPKTFGQLTLNIQPKDIAAVQVSLPLKKDVVTLDGSLDDWRDVIAYNPVSFEPAGTVVSAMNLRSGHLISPEDAGGVLQLAEDAKNVYLAFSAVDDEVLEGDTVAIKLGQHIFEIPIAQAAKGVYAKDDIEARVVAQEGGFVLEARVARTALQANILTESFNFEVRDVDSQDGADLILSYPHDSTLKP